MKTAIRVIDVTIGAGLFAYVAARRACRFARAWPWPSAPVRVDPVEVGGLSNESIDFLMSRDSTRRS